MVSPKNFERLVVMVSWIHHSPIAPVELFPSVGMKIYFYRSPNIVSSSKISMGMVYRSVIFSIQFPMGIKS